MVKDQPVNFVIKRKFGINGVDTFPLQLLQMMYLNYFLNSFTQPELYYSPFNISTY